MRYSRRGLVILLIVLLPATIILSLLSPFGSTGVFLVLLLWILIPVVIARLYHWFRGEE